VAPEEPGAAGHQYLQLRLSPSFVDKCVDEFVDGTDK
jgi:hypothetical protein